MMTFRNRCLAGAASVLALGVLVAPGAAAVDGSDESFELSGSVLGGDPNIPVPIPQKGLVFDHLSGRDSFVVGHAEDDNVWVWGTNGAGALGYSSTGSVNLSVQRPVPLLWSKDGDAVSAVTDSSAGSINTFLTDSEGGVWGYGRQNTNLGELGHPGAVAPDPAKSTAFPNAIEVLRADDEAQLEAVNVSGGEQWAAAVGEDGLLYTWGQNLKKQLGRGNTGVTNTKAAPAVNTAGEAMKYWGDNPTLEAIQDRLAPAYNTLLLIDSDGALWGAGEPDSGLLGENYTSEQASIVPLNESLGVAADKKFTAISSRRDYALALDEDGNAWAWGNAGAYDCDILGINQPATQGNDLATMQPVVDDAGEQMQFVEVSATPDGDQSSLGLDADGHVWSWGCENYLGRTDGARMGKVLDADGNPIVADHVFALSYSNFAALRDPVGAGNQQYNVVGWGKNGYGTTLGVGTDPATGGLRGCDMWTDDPDCFTQVPLPVKLPPPPFDGTVFFGANDATGVELTVTAEENGLVDAKNVATPKHIAGRVPVYAEWDITGMDRNLIGYYTFRLTPSIAAAQAAVKVGETATVTFSVPETEASLVGESETVFGITGPNDTDSDIQADARGVDGGLPLGSGVITAEFEKDSAGTYQVCADTYAPDYVDLDSDWVEVADQVCTTVEFTEDETELIEVTPQAPTLSEVDCDEVPEVVLPEMDGVEYALTSNGEVVTVVATPAAGYEFPAGVDIEWEFTLAAVPCEVEPELIEVIPQAPTLSEVDCDEVPEVVLPQMDGVEYALTSNGEVATVVATPAAGYEFPAGVDVEWELNVSSEECRSFTVSFDVNGGENQDDFPEISVKEGEMITIYTQVPTRDGYTFDGWQPRVLSRDAALIQPGASYLPIGDTVFTAQWKMNETGPIEPPVEPTEPTTQPTEPETGTGLASTGVDGLALIGAGALFLAGLGFSLRRNQAK